MVQDYVQGNTGQTNMVFTFKDGTQMAVGPTTTWATDTPKFVLPVCGNFVGMNCDFHTNPQSVVDKLGACEIYDDVPVTYYTIFTTISSFTYTLNGNSVSKTWESSELGCYNEQFTATYAKSGATISKPSFITFTGSTLTFAVYSTSDSDVGVYTVTIRGTLTSLTNPATNAPWFDEFTFTLTVQSDCIATTLTDRTINNMALLIGSTSTQDATFVDTIATSHSLPTYCGPRTYTFTPSKTFLTVINGSTLQVASNDLADVGTYNVSMLVKLTDFPAIAGITKTFTVTVSCTVTTLSFSTSPISTKTIEIGIDSQPFTTNYAVTKTPNCTQNPTFTLSQTLSFITSTNNADNISGVVTINNATLANKGTYAMTLAASVDGKTASAAFTIIIKDPCSRAVFQTSPAPLSSMTVTMPSAVTSNQAVSIKTDVQNSYPAIVCGITGALTPTAAYISLSSDSSTISVNAANISLPTDIGTHTFTLKVNSLLYSSTVAQQTYTFNVIIVCAVSSLTINTQPANTNYTLNQGTLTTTALSISQSSACNLPYTYSHAYKKNGSPTTAPTWISFSGGQFTMTITAPADIGTYSVTTTSTIPQVDPSTGANRFIASTFNIVVASDCTNTVITSKTINDMTHGITLSATTQNIFFADSIATGHSNLSYCGARTYVLSPSTHAFLSIASDTLTVQSSLVADVGIHPMTLTVSLADYPSIPSVTKTFTVYITCTVAAVTFASQPPAITSFEVGVDAEPNDMNFSLTITPNCAKTTTFALSPNLTFVTQSTNADGNSGKVTIKNATLANKGTNTMTLTATVDGMTASAAFTIIIKDPCSRAVFQTTPTPISNMTVTMPSALTSTQAVSIKTDVQNSYPTVICGITAALTPTAAFISLSGDSSTISVNAANISLPTDIGTYTFTLTVNSLLYSSTVLQTSVNFKVIVSCVITDFSLAAPLPDFTYYIGQGSAVVASFELKQTQECNYPVTIGSPTYLQNGSFIGPIAGLSFNQGAKQWTFLSTDTSLAGTFNTIGTQATVQVINPATGQNWAVQISFNLRLLLNDCKTTKIINKGFGNMNYTISSIPTTQNAQFNDEFSSLQQAYGKCGALSISFSPMKPFISFDGTNVVVQTNDMTQVGSSKVTMTASLVDYPSVMAASVSFNVIIASPCTLTKLQLPQIADMTIKVGDPSVVQTFTQSTDTEAIRLNKPDLCGERSYSIIGAKSPITLISPLDPWKDPFKLSLQAFSANLVGEYSLTLSVTLVDYPAIVPATSAFKVIIQKPDSPPRFKDPLASTIVIAKTWEPQSWSFTLPQVYDDDSGYAIKITSNLGAASTFLMIVDQKKLVVDDISASHILADFYVLKFTLDNSKQQSFYSTMLFVYDAPPKEVPKQEEAPPQPKCEVEISKPQIQETITYVSGTSPMMVSWDSFKLKGSKECTEGKSIQVSIKTIWQDNRFANENDWLQYTANTIGADRASSYFTISSDQIYDREIQAYISVIATAEELTSSFDLAVTIKPASSPQAKRWIKAKPPVLMIQEVSESGLITLEFDSPIIVFNRPTDPFMMDPAKYLEFTVVKNPLCSYYEDPEYIKSGKVLSITVTSFSARQIQVQLELSNPLYVSLDTFYRDQLKVRIVDESTFVSAVDFMTTSIRNSVSQIEIFRFLSKEIAASVESLQKQQTTMNALVTGSMPLNIVLGLSLKYLWGMVNSLQFVIFMDQWKVNWPPNASMAIKTVRTVALAEFIDTNKVKQKAFDFYGLNQTHPDAPARRLEVTQAVQGTRYDRIAISVVIILFVISLLVVAIFFTFRSQFKDKLIKALRDLKNSIFWNGLIRFYLQSFLKQTITIGITFASIKMGQSHKKENKSSKIAFAAIESIAMFIVVPILFVHVLKKNRNYLFLSSVKQKFGSLYLGIRTDSLYRIYYVLEFLSVRFLFVTITFALARYPGILVNMYMLLNNANIVYLGWFKPFDTRSQNNLELINSWMLHLIAYALLLLANLMPNPQNEINVGWAVIGFIGAIFLINFGFMMSLNVQKLMRSIYFWKLKREILRKKREREEAKRLQSIELVVRPLVPEQASPLQIVNLVSDDQTDIPLKKRPVTPSQQEIAILQHNVDCSLQRISSLNESVRNESDSSFVSSLKHVIVPSHNSALVKSRNSQPELSHDSVFVSSYEIELVPQNETSEINEMPTNNTPISFMAAPLAGIQEFEAKQTPSIPLNEEKSVMQLIIERAARREPRMESNEQPQKSVKQAHQQLSANQQAFNRINQRLRERQAFELNPSRIPNNQNRGIDEVIERLENIVAGTTQQPQPRTSRF